MDIQEMQAEIFAKGVHWIPIRKCSLCDATIGFVVEEGDLYFDGGCDCSSRYGPQPRPWEDLLPYWEQKKKEEGEKRPALGGPILSISTEKRVD